MLEQIRQCAKTPRGMRYNPPDSFGGYMPISKTYYEIKDIEKQHEASQPANDSVDTSQKVSVIIPIYNTAEFLDQALDSVQNQSYLNLEIICINDGSTDNSLEIIKDHAANDDRIVIIDKANEGYGASCNRGIDEATGDWIAIVEPDDWIEQDMYKDMLEFASQYPGAQIVKTPFINIFVEGSGSDRTNCSYRNLVNPKKQPFRIEDETELIKAHPSIWSAIYKKSFLEEKHIRFKPIPGAGWSDNPFLIETMCQADQIIWLDKPFYCYRCDTAEKLESFHRNNYRIPFDRWNEMLDIIEELGITDERILMAHYNRGFIYMAGVIEYNGTDNPEIVQLLKDMFARMDADMVLNSTNVSPGAKRLFAEMRGLPKPKIRKGPYLKRLVTSTFTTMKNNGPLAALYEINHYRVTHGKRTGHR